MSGMRCSVLGKSARGFTLVEVLAALGVFAFAVIGLMLALNTTLSAANATKREAEVRNEMQDRLARLSVGSLREFENKEELNGVVYIERVQREEIEDDEQTVLRGFWRLSVGAEWVEDGGEQKWTVSHLVYRNE